METPASHYGSSVRPDHLLVSLQSLQSICRKKASGAEMIDNKELTQLYGRVRDAVSEYQDKHNIPELELILDRMPPPRSYELHPGLLLVISDLYRAVGILLMALTPFFFLYTIGLLFFWAVGWIAGTIALRKNQSRIAGDMRDIPECCANAIMLIRNNESYLEEPSLQSSR